VSEEKRRQREKSYLAAEIIRREGNYLCWRDGEGRHWTSSRAGSWGMQEEGESRKETAVKNRVMTLGGQV
jgi:hypothetical protein